MPSKELILGELEDQADILPQLLRQILDIPLDIAFAIDEIGRLEIDLGHEPLLEILPEARPMALGKGDILIKMEHLHLGPVDILLHQSRESLELALACAEDHAGMALLSYRITQQLRYLSGSLLPKFLRRRGNAYAYIHTTLLYSSLACCKYVLDIAFFIQDHEISSLADLNRSSLIP